MGPPQGPEGPPIEFWENALEFPTERALKDAKSPADVGNWIQRLNARQVSMLRHLLKLPLDVPARQRKAGLMEHMETLTPFIIVSKFASRKSRYATLAVAAEVIDKATIEIAKEGEGRYDTTALMFAIMRHVLAKARERFSPRQASSVRLRAHAPSKGSEAAETNVQRFPVKR